MSSKFLKIGRMCPNSNVYLDILIYGNFWKNGRFSGRIWPDWGNTARADLAGLGSIGLKLTCFIKKIDFQLYKTSKSDKTNIICTLFMKNVLFILDILFSVTMATC